MKKMWETKVSLNKLVEEYTVGNDYILDIQLIPFDIIMTQAHAKMLHKINIFSDEELSMVLEGLAELNTLVENDEFSILPEQEDCHTAVEHFLTTKYGVIGKKINTEEVEMIKFLQ